MGEFAKRAVTAILFVAIIVTGIFFHPYCFYIVFLAISILGTNEFYTLVKKKNISANKTVGILGSIILFSAGFAHAYYNEHRFFYLLIPLLVFTYISEMYRKKEEAISNIAHTILGVIYIGLPFTLLNYILFTGDMQSCNSKLVLGIFLFTWANDTGAYMFGVKFGKTRLFERISPKKSWEGSIGGGITCLITAGLYSLWSTDLSLVNWISIGLIVVIFGSLGDLVESLMKRDLQTKDSGTILPGHGGILDRFDAILLAIPMVFVYLLLLKDFA